MASKAPLAVPKKGKRSVAAGPAQEPGPIKQASPESEAAKPQSGVMFTRAYDAFGVPYAWLKQLAVNEDSILKREGLHDLKLFDALLDDDVAFSTFQQRQLALVAKAWDVEPGDDSAPAKAAADHLRLQLAACPWDRICVMMMFGRWYGYGVGEAMYRVGDDGKIWLDDVLVPDRKWFAFTNEGELRMRSPQEPDGLAVPDNKFWAFRVGATHDFAPYGTGLAHWCYWPIWFKKNVLKFWALFLEKFGQPTTLGLLPPGTSDTDPLVGQTLEAAQAVGRDSAVVVNAIVDGKEGFKSPIEVVEAARSGSGASSYDDFVKTMDEALTRVILGQTMTSRAASQGIGSNQSDTQKDVRDEIVKSDSDLLHESFNRTIARWLTLWNFGPGVAAPRVYRNMEDAEDLNTVADRDAKLYAIGIRRTPESVKETYGEGYDVVDLAAEKAAADAAALKLAGAQGKQGPGGKAANNNNERVARVGNFAADDPAPLYVSRKLVNAADLLAWAKGQGFTNLIAPEELHVTVLYSKDPVDWFAMDGGWGGSDGRLEIPPGGARKVEPMGDKGAVALVFSSADLRWRHESMVESGASHDYESYLPHVTFTMDATGVDLAAVQPFTGKLVFGPEIFEEIRDDHMPALIGGAPEFSAEDMDAIDALADALVAEASPVFAAMADTLRDAVRGAIKTPEGLRIALLDAMERLPIERLAELGAVPMLAARATAAAGVEDLVT